MLKVLTIAAENGANTQFPNPIGKVVEVMEHNRRRGTLTVLVSLCGTEKEDGSLCERDPDDCQYH